MEIENDLLGLDRIRRVQINVDVSKPLRRMKRMLDKGGKEVKVEFAYERLPFLCFACGILGHSERDCSRVSEEEKRKKLKWGLFLRASPIKGRAKLAREVETIAEGRQVLFITKEKGDGGEESRKGVKKALFVNKAQVADLTPLEVIDDNVASLGLHTGETSHGKKDS